ncbi:EAL domain-containing protein [Cohnella lubricantis]
MNLLSNTYAHLNSFRQEAAATAERFMRHGLLRSNKSLHSEESYVEGNRLSIWPNRDWIHELSAAAGSGPLCLMIVHWSRKQRTGDGERDQAETPLRMRRLLRAAAYRFRSQMDGRTEWVQSGDTLVLLTVVPEAPQGTDRHALPGRLEYLLRETVFRTMTSKLAGSLSIREGTFRFGWAWLDWTCGQGVKRSGKPRAEPPAAGGAKSEEALLSAWQMAWKRTLDASAVMNGAAFRKEDPMSAGEIEIRYAPMLSLLDGSLFGFEAVPYRRRTGQRWPAAAMLAEAEAAGRLYECDRRFREAAIRALPIRHGEARLFIQASASIMNDARLYPGTTLRRMEAAGIRPEHVVLVFEVGTPSAERDGDALRAAVRHYRDQGFRIALTGIEAKRESLLRMLTLHPDYARIDVGWMAMEESDDSRTIDESLLGALSRLARKEQIVLLAGGIERDSQIGPLIASGIVYGQGSWIGPEAAAPASIGRHVRDRIRLELNKRYRREGGSLSELSAPVETFSRQTPVSDIARHFESRRDIHGFVIAEEGRPVGLLMKEKLHQLLSGQFGLPLYWNRPVDKIMDTQPLIADESTPIDQVSQMAMAREPDKLYDAVVVTRDGLVSGIASIRSLLEWVTNARMTDAQWANPLTGLPGNEPIRKELTRRIGEGRPFAVLYADVDYFKWFNDRFGFHRGDEVIRFTADVIVSSVQSGAQEDAFVGHIGGDDFIAVIGCEEANELSRLILERFEQGIAGYIGSDAGPVVDREGQPVEAEGLSISLSLLLCEDSGGWTPDRLAERAAHLKKRAKLQQGNSFVWESIRQEPIAANNMKHGVESS